MLDGVSERIEALEARQKLAECALFALADSHGIFTTNFYEPVEALRKLEEEKSSRSADSA